MNNRRAILICIMLVVFMLASCRTTEVDLVGLAGEIDRFNPAENSFPGRGVVYIGSDGSYHYFRIVKPFASDLILGVKREELSIPQASAVTNQKKQWRWMYGSSREIPWPGYAMLFSVDTRHYFIQLWSPIALVEAPVPGMRVEAGYEPTAIAFSPSMSSTLHFGYLAQYDGLDYLLVVSNSSPDDRIVSSVQTHDPGFVTPEGLRVGDTYEKVLGANAPDETQIISMGQCAVLRKSGWVACFEGDTLERSETLRPGPDSKIEWFEKWRVPGKTSAR